MNPESALVDMATRTERCTELLTEMTRIRSVVGEKTNAHIWVADNLRSVGMEVQLLSVEARPTPLVLGVLEGNGDGPGVLFDAHYDTVGARPEDWDHDPWGAEIEDGLLYGRGAVDSKGPHVAMFHAIEALVASGRERSGPIYFMSDSDGEDGFRGPTLLADLDVARRVGTVFSAEATRNSSIEIAYPGISTWKITAIGRTAHPTEPERGINAITKMAKLVTAVAEGRLEFPVSESKWFDSRVTTNAIRTLPGGGWAIPARCDTVLSVLTPAGTSLPEVDRAILAFLRKLEAEDGEVRFEHKILPMGAGRLWLRPGESDPEAPGIKALEDATATVKGDAATVKEFNGGWVSAVELMRPGANGYDEPVVLTYGPGDFELAHAVDEHISLEEVAEASAIYARATASLLT